MNVINFKRLCIILLPVVFISCLSSCREDIVQKVEISIDNNVAYSKVTFYYACSPDLLEIATPVFVAGSVDNVADIVDNVADIVGNVKDDDLIRPSVDEFRPSGKKFPITLSTSTFGGDSIETEEDFYTYTISQRFDDVSGNYLLASALSFKEGFSAEEFPDKDYLYYNGFCQVEVEIYNKEDVKISSKTVNIPMTGSKQESGLGALLYLYQEIQGLKGLLYSWEYDKDTNKVNVTISPYIIKTDGENSETQTPVNVKSLPDMIRSNGNNSVEKMKEYLELHKTDILDKERGNVYREQITIPLW